MFFNAVNSSINTQCIEYIDWNFAVDNNGTWDDVVVIYTLSQPERLYLYYNDPEGCEAILRLKNLVNYPHPLPLLQETINKDA